VYDSHCHLDFPELAGALDEHLRAARACGVERWHVPGCGPSQWGQLADVRGREGVTVSVGVHPWWVDEVECPESDDPRAQARALDEAMQRLATELRAQGAVALGECGLDRPKALQGGPSRERQRVVFEAQLALARELELPVVLHVVGEHGATLDLLARVGPLPRGGVVHGYSGSVELVDRYVDHGLFIGFGARLTGTGARRARESLQRVPRDHLLLETDAPDQAPAVEGRFERGRRGTPADLVVVVEEAARQLRVSTTELAEDTARNARRLFGV